MGNTKYWNEVRKIVDEESVSFAEARKLWRQRKRASGRQDSGSNDSCKITSEQEALALSCPYCRDMLVSDDAAYQCNGCSTVYHEECMEEFKKCATLGCKGKGRKKEIKVQETRKIVVTVPPENSFSKIVLGPVENERQEVVSGQSFDLDSSQNNERVSFVESPALRYSRIAAGTFLIVVALYTLAIFILQVR